MDINLSKYLIELAPGFLGIATNNIFTGETNNEKSYKKDSLNFFTYTFISWIITNIINFIFIVLTDNNTGISENQFLAITCITSCFLGLSWALFLKDFLLTIINYINRKFNKNEIFLNKTILEEITRDNQPHYLIIKKNNNIVAKGWVENCNPIENGLSLTPLPNIDKDKDNNGDIDENEYIFKTIVFLDKDTIIQEKVKNSKQETDTNSNDRLTSSTSENEIGAFKKTIIFLKNHCWKFLKVSVLLLLYVVVVVLVLYIPHLKD